MNPLFLNNVVAGFKNNERYLASVDLFGTYIESNYIVTVNEFNY